MAQQQLRSRASSGADGSRTTGGGGGAPSHPQQLQLPRTAPRAAAVAGALLLVAAMCATYILRGELAIVLMRRLAPRRLTLDAAALLVDGIHVAICGAGAPMFDEARRGPCTLVVAGGVVMMFDAGAGAAQRLAQMGFAVGKLQHLFLTHYHSDHIDGLGELFLQRWVNAGAALPLPVHGPPGVERLVAGLMDAYRLDAGYRVAHHGNEVLPQSGYGGAPLAFDVAAGPRVVLRAGGVEVTAFPVDHGPVRPAVGYRISYAGRSVALSGDTVATAGVGAAAAGVDVLLHEALSERMVGVLADAARAAGRENLQRILQDIPGYHSTPERAAGVAAAAGAGMLVLHHIVPPLLAPGSEKAFLGDAASVFPGRILVATDGDLISLPAHTKEVTLTRLL